MKKLAFLLLFLSALVAGGQTYRNEWIDYTKTYYKFKVPVNGLYRITQPVLTAAGLGNTPAEQFQLWRNGQQVPVYTTVATGVLGASDYIEFWGEGNDGRPDKDLYRVPDHQLNDRVSLETDTASYFLTVNASGGNLRLRPATNNLPTALQPEPYFLHTVGRYYRERIFNGTGVVVGSVLYSSDYEGGEGYTSNDIGLGATRTENLGSLFPYLGPGAPDPVIRVNASGNALNTRTFEVSLNGSVAGTQTMNYYDHVKASFTLPLSVLSSGTGVLAVKNNATVGPDRMVIAQSEVVYARQFNFGGANNFLFELPASATENYLVITGFNYGTSAPVLLDLTNGFRYVADITNAPQVRIVLQPSSTSRRLLLVTAESSYPVAVTSLQQRNFINYSLPANRGDYLIVSHPALTTKTGGGNPVEEYRAYRASAAGGGYSARVYMIDQLIDQFAYGIKDHPLSVRNFLRWARASFPQTIKGVFLIGKGLHYVHNRGFESNANIQRLSFIPTFGFPASDNLLTADPGPDVTPRIPIGRLSVINGDEVALYLRKMIQYDEKLALSSPLIRDKGWQKEVVHVMGAWDEPLATILTTAMGGYETTLTDTLYGAHVNNFSKKTNAPVEQVNITRLYSLFESGISLMTYFGHSSASTLEFNLDNPLGYNNAGKYPLFILLGCNAGNFYNFNLARLSTKETISENFVLADQRGSIGCIASTSLGVPYYLDVLNAAFTKAMTGNRYGATLGDVMVEAIVQTYMLTTQNDFYARIHCEQNSLHGDPAMRLHASFPKPDYAIEDPMVEIDPSFISVAENDFTVRARFMNIGKAISRPLVVEFKRTFPDQTTLIRRDTLPGIRYMDSISYTLPILATRDKGANRISITIDPDNAIDELYETNNTVSRDVFIYEDELRPVYPFNLGIVNRQGIRFHASTANPFSAPRPYIMELDTTE
ncbi:MAG: hypothetical protein RJA57_1194, partial [Bacteroidota bacterium]